MLKNALPRLLMLILTAALVVTGCSPASTPLPPTEDSGQVSTNAVKTFAAQLTQAAPTDTIAATEMPQVATMTLDGAAVNLVTSLTPTPPAAEAAAAAVSTSAVADKANLISQFPLDGGEARKARHFDVTWTVQNTGKTTWTKTYTLRYFAGAALGETYTYKFNKEVKPGEQINLTADMIAPNYTGTFNSIWVLTNDQGQNFYQVYVTIKIIDGPTTTPSPTEDLTPAATSAG